jgi:hypothetical protein
VVFGLGLRDSCLVVLFFNLLCCALPAYLWVSTLVSDELVKSSVVTGLHGAQSWVCDKWFKLATVSGTFARAYPQRQLTDIPRRYYGVIVTCVFNLVVMFGFCVLNCILGGQSLSSVTGGSMSWTLVHAYYDIPWIDYCLEQCRDPDYRRHISPRMIFSRHLI